MPSLKNKGITLFLLLVVYVWFFVGKIPQVSQQNPNILGAQANVAVFTQPESGIGPITDAIVNAKHEILIEVYLLSDKKIIDALCLARERGVAVNVMLEEHPFGGGKYNIITKNKLESCDIAVNFSNPNFSLTHEKALVIDSNILYILNQNLTGSSFSKNREYNILDKNLQDVSQAREIFIDDWQRKNLKPTKSNLIISPDNSRTSLKSFLQSAKANIDIEMEVINDNEIISILTNSAKVKTVRLIVPTIKQLNANKSSIEKLKDKGVQVKILSSPYIHAKLILVDNKKAYVGSINLSSESMDSNRELGIIVTEKDVLSTIETTFEKDWNMAIRY